MNIDRSNYEIYFLDFLEGRMTPGQEAEIRLFLEKNPDLWEEMEVLRETYQEPTEEILYPDKNELTRKFIPVGTLKPENIDEWLIALAEGDANPQEQREISEFLELNPTFKRSLHLIHQVRFEPDLAVQYPEKEQLKRRRATVIPFAPVIRTAVAAIAASVLIFLGIRWFQSPPAHPTKGLKPVSMQRLSASLDQPRHQPPILQKSLKEQTEIPEETGTPLPPARRDILVMQSFRPGSIEIPIADRYPYYILPETDLYYASLILVVEEDNRSVIGRIFANIFNTAAERVMPESEAAERENRFSVWTVAKYGIEGYNLMADKDIELITDKNNNGRVTSYTLVESDEVLLSKDTRNKE